MDIALLHTHITAVTLFLIFLAFKTVLLVFKKVTLLKTIRNKTKLIDSLLGLAIIVTGGYLVWIKGTIASYLLIKIILVLIAIPLGIVAMRKENTIGALSALMLFIYLYGVAETRSLKFKQEAIKLLVDDAVADNILENNVEKQLIRGCMLYQALCEECHGKNGNKCLYNAPNPFESTLSQEAKSALIVKGKGVMKGFGKILTNADIAAFLAYITQSRIK